MIVIGGHETTSRLSSLSSQHSEAIWGCDFNMAAELPIAPPNTITSGISTTTTTRTTTETTITTAAAALAAAVLMMIVMVATSCIVINITASIRYCLSMTSRCSTPSQHINNKLPTTCCICDNNDCIYETTSGNNLSSSTSTTANDDCEIVENVVFYINMLAQPNTKLPMPTAFDGNKPFGVHIRSQWVF